MLTDIGIILGVVASWCVIAIAPTVKLAYEDRYRHVGLRRGVSIFPLIPLGPIGALTLYYLFKNFELKFLAAGVLALNAGLMIWGAVYITVWSRRLVVSEHKLVHRRGHGSAPPKRDFNGREMSSQTAKFIHGRILGGLSDGEYSSWAVSLLDAGYESSEIIDLAGTPNIHWQERESKIKTIYLQIGLSQSIENKTNAPEWLMDQWIADYNNGKISAAELIRKGYDTWIISGCDQLFSCWCWLDEEIDLIESGIQAPPRLLKDGYTIDELRIFLINESGIAGQCEGGVGPRI